MCTLVLLRRPDHAWPLIVAANRDEMAGRAADPPDRHWPDRAEVTAGRDRLAGGTWLGLSDSGLIAGILNRRGTLGPAEGLRSRGELPLEALDHRDAALAAEALAHLEPTAYRAFNLVVADARRAFLLFLEHGGDSPVPDASVTVTEIPPGLSMITALGLNDPRSARVRTYLPRFRKAAVPTPGKGDWRAWTDLLASRLHDATSGPEGAMTVAGDGPFGTVSSSLLALPAPGAENRRAAWLFADGRPGEAPFLPVLS